MDPSDEQKYMTDRELLDKYIDLENSCLTKEEKKEVIEMLYSNDMYGIFFNCNIHHVQSYL